MLVCDRGSQDIRAGTERQQEERTEETEHGSWTHSVLLLFDGRSGQGERPADDGVWGEENRVASTLNVKAEVGIELALIAEEA